MWQEHEFVVSHQVLVTLSSAEENLLITFKGVPDLSCLSCQRMVDS